MKAKDCRTAFGSIRYCSVGLVARVNFPEGDEVSGSTISYNEIDLQQIYMLNMPDFLAVKHRNFDYDTYEPPTQPHDGANKDRRSRMDEIEGDEDEDAEGEEDTEFLKNAAAGGLGAGGGRKRRVIDDDEDEDE